MTSWSALLYVLTPGFIGHLLWRGVRYPAYWRRWPERFGYLQPLRGARVIWVHAVSVGEVRSAAALITRLREIYPDHKILVTTMTPTGSEQVMELFGDSVCHAYVPYDFPGCVRRFMERVAPEFAVIAETEFWPNLFRACADRRIPLLLVNVRLSQASLQGYLWVPKTARAMIANASLICAQTRADAHRLKTLGASDRLLHVTGNLKFDAAVPEDLIGDGRRLREQWGGDRSVLVAGSTHRGEEKKILGAFALLRDRFPELLLVLVPRHPERFGSVARMCRRAGYRIARRSSGNVPIGSDVDILIGDTMGELQKLYSAADVAFVGGSLARCGGHNILEACAVGCPVLFGPHMFHFEEIGAMAIDHGAGRQIHDAAGLADAVSELLATPAERRAAGEAARQLVAMNRGALDRTLELMQQSLSTTERRTPSASSAAAG
jgi:3-deoxy-D-manno-octulosonic-acid transferase